MAIESLIDGVIGREGGYSNLSADKGGPTRWGVTEAVARAHGYAGNMQEFPREEAVSIYRRLYWLKPGFDLIEPVAPRIAAELFDTGVNMGPGTAVGFLIRALNVLNRNGTDYRDIGATMRVDSSVITGLKSFMAKRGKGGEIVLLKALEALQGERYVRLAEKRSANENFLYGWLANRVGDAA